MPEPVARVRGFPVRGPDGAPATLGLDVHAGELVLLAGPNGSGKTSLLRALAGLPSPLAPSSTAVAGADPRGLHASALAGRVGLAQQDPRESLVGLTVRSEFRLRASEVPPPLAAWADRDVATLSSGEARRVALAAADARRPRLLLLDEPTEGLDAAGRARLLAEIADARGRGASVVAADHSGLLDGLATRRVELGPSAALSVPPPPRPGGAAVLHAPPHSVRLGATRIDLPGVALGPGFHALAGPNGSGKSTLLARLAGLRHADGVLLRGGRPEPGRDARLLLARPGELFTAASVEDELGGASPDPRLVPGGLLGRHPLALSAGEAQRVALAKVLGSPAPLYLLDEPEARLDAAGRAVLAGLVADRVHAGAIVVAATHDAGLLAAARSILHLGPPAAHDGGAG